MLTQQKIIHGGDYNPEQWLEHPEILEEDLLLMKKAAVNCVTLGVFSWSVLEPEEGYYDLTWLARIIDRLHENDISVILATPSGAMPHWLTARYEEVMQVSDSGQRNLPGRRHNFCYTSPIMREKIRGIDLELSKRFGQHPAVILWHISNELGGNFSDGACHCSLCQRAFRQWLKNKYGTLDDLNHAWWNRFWSHVYTDWEEIHSPAPHGECLSHGLNLDWKRFVTAQMTDFCREEIQAVKTCSSLPVTTNYMDFFKNLDYHKLHLCLDIVSWDNYPHWHASRDEVPVAVRAAANHSMMRSMKKQPFLLMESTPSCVNWRPFNPIKRPGMHMLSSLQAIAHGSASVQYFQWRKGRGAYEKFHGAVLDHKNGENTRTFREVAELGRRLAALSPLLEGSLNHPRVALIFDWENWWALEDAAGPRQDMDYVAEILKHYQILWENGIEADFINMEDSLDGYLLIIAPFNYLYRRGYAEKVRRYVQNGGYYLTTCFSGIVDDTDLCFTGCHPLADILGITPEEIDAPGNGFDNAFSWEGRTFAAGNLREISHPHTGTHILATYETDFYAGFPVVTEKSSGKGCCCYLATDMEKDFLSVYYKNLFSRLELENPFHMPLPYGVTTTVRRRRDKQELVFVMNFSHEKKRLEQIGIWQDMENGCQYQGSLTMEPLSCRIVCSVSDNNTTRGTNQ